VKLGKKGERMILEATSQMKNKAATKVTLYNVTLRAREEFLKLFSAAII
jgi:hypothetical protein